MLISKIKQGLKGQDKLIHSLVGNVSFLFAFVIYINLFSFLQSLIMAAISLLIVAISKELYDKYIKRTFIDWWDIVAAFVPFPIIKKIQNL